MALNIATFKTRAGTAGIFVVVMLAGMLWNQWSFFILFSIIHFGCWIEYQKLIRLIDKNYLTISPVHEYGVMLAGWALMLYAAGKRSVLAGVSLQTIGMWLGLAAVVALVLNEIIFIKRFNSKNTGWSLFGLLYISMSLAMMIDLRFFGETAQNPDKPGTTYGYLLPLGILIALWINDTMAYMVGSFIGKTPFSKISPKKTWEGTIGGAILCIAVVTLLGKWVHVYSAKDWLCIATIIAFFGVLGDLFESKLKRMANVKDSGSIMPGHGGFLDRFDSLLLATPFVWLYVIIFMK